MALARGQVIGAVTSAEKPIAGCKRLSLGKLRYHATASPEFVARNFPAGVTAKALAAAPSLTFNQKDRLQSSWIKQTLGEDVQGPLHWLPSSHGFVDACLMGMGWGMNPVHLVKDHLATDGSWSFFPLKRWIRLCTGRSTGSRQTDCRC